MLISRRKTQFLGAALGTIFYGAHVAEALNLDLTSTESIKSAASAVAYDMMTYYRGNYSGQTVGLLPDPYYWWEAGAMFGQMVEYWFYTGDDTYNKITSEALLAQVGPSNDFMPPNQTKTEGNDDQAFWAFAAMSAVEMNFPDPPPDKPSWLSLAQAVFNLQTSRWDTANCGGGLRWQIFAFNKGYDYKNTISNGGFFQLAARLARYTNNGTYADWAVKSWDWMRQSTIFTDNYEIYDGAFIADNCTTPSTYRWTYNVGTLLMGAANMYNYTNGDPVWKERIELLLTNGSAIFFPTLDIMSEVACEPTQSCNYDQPSFKAYLSRWMAATVQIAPFTEADIMKRLKASAIGAAGQCSGGANGRTCGRRWAETTWDGKAGVGEQMSALSVIQATLIQKVTPPVTADNGGTSKSDPSAGTQGDRPNPLEPLLTRKITTGDRVGAAIITALSLSGCNDIARVVARTHYNSLQSALFPQGNKAIAFTTSLPKKRKISRSDTPESTVSIFASMLDGSSSASSQQQSQSSPSPTGQLPPANPPASSTRVNSSSPARSIPPHMILEGAATGRSPTPELTVTGGSSPSAACAGLTLDCEGSSEILTAGVKASAGTLAIRDIKSRTNLSDRSSSPAAKRTAAAMEDTPIKNEDVDVVMDIKVEAEEDSVNTSEPSLSPHSTNLTQKSHGNRHKREVSVDTLAYGASPIKESDSKSEEMPFLVAANGSQNLGISTSSNPAPDAMITASGLPPTSTTMHDSIPSIDEQIEQVMQLAQKPMEAGQKGFVISAKWLARVLSRGSNPRDGTDRFGKETRIGNIGPVDNTGLNLIVDPSMGNFRDEAGDPFVPLKPGLQMSEDFEILPKEAWDLTIKWYGLQAGSTIITRYCHNTSTNETRENLQFELHPPVFTILKLPDTSGGMTTNTLKEKDLMPVKLLASRHERFNSFLKRVKELGNIPLKTKVRIWRILGGLGRNAQTGMLTPAQSRSTSPSPTFVPPVDPGDRLVMDVNTFVNLELGSQRELVDANDETANEKYNGHATLDLIGLRQDEVIVVEEQIGGPAGGEWVSDAVGRQAKTNGVAISVTKAGSTVVRDTLKPGAAKVASSGRISPALGGMMTRGRQQKNGRTRGTAGLSNLGNTCYMNSALQCIRSVEELTQYFLMDKYKKDLNPTNPLSHNGHVAKAYAGLLSEMYSPNASFSFAPRNFKNIIGKYGPSFSGYQQQDSQEFLLFLIDGLQEDLSRIHLKPYIEKPDSTDEMVNNPAALRELADKCWDIYKARNDSVITDLFAGMYKSTVICPVCGKVSIIFDPFNNLTLQLPVENVWSRTVYFMPLHSRPVTIGVDIDKNASFVALKEYVAAKVGTDPKRLIVAEIYKSRIYKVFDDKKSIVDARIGDEDTIAVFEVEDRPSNYPPPPKKKVPRFKMAYSNNLDEEEDIPEGDSRLADKMLVPIFHRHTKQDSHPRHTLREVFGYPAYIIITREEAKDYDAILQKILAKIDTMTTGSILKDEGGPDSTPEDSDGVLMSTEDVDSSASDSRIQTKSLEGEEGLIDISMRDAGDVSRGSSGAAKDLPVSKHKSLPRVLRPGEFIPHDLRTLFDIKYFTANQEMVPTGWATLQDESRDYPKIEAREPIADIGRRRDTKGKLARRIQRRDSASSSDADDDVRDVGVFSAQNQTSYDSDSDNGLPPVESVTQAPIGFARFNKTTHRDGNGQLSNSRKGKNKAQYNDYDDSEAEAEPPALIRLGEAIVLDWNTEAYELLFTATETNQEGHAAPTWETIPAMSDPELEAKRRQRANRKRNGISLEDCLDEFNKAEVLSEADAWYCPRCKEHRRASKKFELWKAPDILVIHLKRFSRNLRDKLEILVDFPVEGLDLSSRVAMREDGKSLTYDLFAVDNHYGGLAGGHYTAFAKNFYDNNWYEYNDSSVSRRGNPSVVVTTAAYLLFYRRRSFQPLGGHFFEKIVNAANSPSQSQSGSRTTSPSGEGKRLEDSPPFRNGFSSALTGVGAIHQAGGGGLEVARTAAPMRTGVDDDLPSYSSSVGNIGDRAAEALQSMEVDEEDEGIADTGDRFRNTVLPVAGWSFANLESIATPGSDQEDEAIYDDDSTKAVSPTSDSDRNIDDYIDDNEGQGDERRLPTLIQDEGTTSGAFGSYRSGSTPLQDIPPLIESYEDPAVAEVRVVEGDEMFTSQD